MRFRLCMGKFLSLFLVLMTGLAMAQDMPGASDHPLLHRAAGATLVGYAQVAHGNLDFQVAPYVDFNLDTGKRNYSAPALALDGRITRLWYEVPGKTTASELFQVHAKELLADGFNTLYDSATDTSNASDKWVNFLATFAPGKRDAIPAERSPRVFANARTSSLRAGTYQKDNTTVRLVAVDWPTAEDSVQAKQGAYIAIDVVEARRLSSEAPAPAPATAVHANDAAPGPAWRGALERAGHVALGGVEFESGSAVLSESSRAVLEQVADYLKARQDVRLFVVGHTDSTGDVTANMELSRRRAAAVASALIRAAPSARGRISAYGVGPLAPMADNTSEAGRASNRRIELVLR